MGAPKLKGQRLLEAGRLADARREFWAEAEAADLVGDNIALAEAALGLGSRSRLYGPHSAPNSQPPPTSTPPGGAKSREHRWGQSDLTRPGRQAAPTLTTRCP
jgi:hypothetical protein